MASGPSTPIGIRLRYPAVRSDLDRAPSRASCRDAARRARRTGRRARDAGPRAALDAGPGIRGGRRVRARRHARHARGRPGGHRRPSVRTTTFTIDTGGRRVVDVSDRVRRFAAEAGGDGLLHVFLPHATAGLGPDRDGAGDRGRPRGDARAAPAPRRPLPPSARLGRARRRSRAAGVRRAEPGPSGRRGRGGARDLAVRGRRRSESRERHANATAELRRRARGTGRASGRGRTPTRTAWTSRSRRSTSSSPSSSTSSPDAGRNSTWSPVDRDPHVGPDQRDVGPLEAFGRGHRGGGDQQSARRGPLAGARDRAPRADRRSGGARRSSRTSAREASAAWRRTSSRGVSGSQRGASRAGV